MQPYIQPIVWALVLLAAVLAGRWFAIRRNRPDDYWLQRSVCPHCRSRKLLPTPLSATRVVITCGDCEGQWLIVGEDGQEIVTGLGHRCYVPPLTFYWDSDGYAVFETKLGFAKFDASDMAFGPELANARSPREALRFLAERKIEPVRCEILSDNGATDDSLPKFLDSAGIDLPFTYETKDH